MGSLYVVATPIGNLKDISQRALDVLSTCDLIAAEDTRRSIKLLNYYNIKTKMISYHKFNEKARTCEIIEKILSENINVALVSDAGTPCISDPGYELVKSARENGITVIGVSGPSAVITALSVSGFKIDSFSFYGFLPRENVKRKKIIESIKKSEINTIVLYESPKRILQLAELIKEELPVAKVCFCCDISKMFENVFYGDIDSVLEMICESETSHLGEYTIVINKHSEKDNIVDQHCLNKESTADEQLPISIEALLLDEMVKTECTMKDAIERVSQSIKNVSKKEIYKASLNLKNIIQK